MKIHGTIQRDYHNQLWFDFKTTQGNVTECVYVDFHSQRNVRTVHRMTDVRLGIQFDELRLNGAHFTIQDTPTSHTTKLEILDVDCPTFFGPAVKVSILGKRMSFCRIVWEALNLPLTTGTFYVRLYRKAPRYV